MTKLKATMLHPRIKSIVEKLLIRIALLNNGWNIRCQIIFESQRYFTVGSPAMIDTDIISIKIHTAAYIARRTVIQKVQRVYSHKTNKNVSISAKGKSIMCKLNTQIPQLGFERVVSEVK
jgi:hypothetical protein